MISNKWPSSICSNITVVDQIPKLNVFSTNNSYYLPLSCPKKKMAAEIDASMEEDDNFSKKILPEIGSASNSVPGSSSHTVKAAKSKQKKSANGNGTKLSRIKSASMGQQRSHPGMLSSNDRATAHYGAVTGLKMTDDGMYLLSAGSDSRLRLWDIESGRNTLVNYEATRLQTTKGIQLAVTQDSSLVFVPCMTAVKAFDIWSGRTFSTFRGHYENVNSCCFGSQDQELYSGSNDRQILVWSPAKSVPPDLDERGGEVAMSNSDQDNWSD